MSLAGRIDRIELSPTFRINAMARTLQAQGIDVLDFSVGEPDFPTPPSAKAAGIGAIEGDLTKYTANEGTLPLRVAIADKLRRENALGWNDAGKSGTKEDCLAYIKEVWTDMRPLSLRKRMEDAAASLILPAFAV